jgi:hypothetical protein
MEIHFPMYVDGVKWWNPKEKGTFIREIDYAFKITTQDEFYDEILKNINDITELVKIYTQVQEQKAFDIFKERIKLLQKDIKSLTKDMPIHIKENYESKVEPLVELVKQNIITIKRFLYENIDETKKTIDRRMIEIKNKLKSARQKANHKYYLKIKTLLKTELPTEQVIQSTLPLIQESPIIETPLTEEQKIQKKKEARQNANKKYYLKQKELIKTDELTEEQKIEKKKEAKKIANKKYYLKNKDKIN